MITKSKDTATNKAIKIILSLVLYPIGIIIRNCSAEHRAKVFTDIIKKAALTTNCSLGVKKGTYLYIIDFKDGKHIVLTSLNNDENTC